MVDDWRAVGFERLLGERFDLFVVGGGIVGAGVAELGARHGFRMTLGRARRLRVGNLECVFEARARRPSVSADG
jgi:hypothetical protein